METNRSYDVTLVCARPFDEYEKVGAFLIEAKVAVKADTIEEAIEKGKAYLQNGIAYDACCVKVTRILG